MTSNTPSVKKPLAERMRPKNLNDIVGQEQALYPQSPLHSLVNQDLPLSVLLWGPPGTGKTAIARAIAHQTNREFIELSATASGVKEVRETLATARSLATGELYGTPQQTIVFIDEIHRFSKIQQDVLLPAVEDGSISLIGATTENPSFSVNAALASRSILVVLKQLDDAHVLEILHRALVSPQGLSGAVQADDEALQLIARVSAGDARQALNRLELAATIVASDPQPHITVTTVDAILSQAMQRYDRDGDQHYDIISAFIKSLRGSDPNAALHWMFRMLASGEDPRYIARRLIVHASEDVGMADPTILPLCIAALDAVNHVGLPEAEINLTHAVVALATAPKSNAIVVARDRAKADIARGNTGPVPPHLRDAHYLGAIDLGHGTGYLYPHDYPDAVVAQQYFPDNYTPEQQYYMPTLHGREAQTYESMVNYYNKSINHSLKETP